VRWTIAGLPSGASETSKERFSCGKSLVVQESRSGPTNEAFGAGRSTFTASPSAACWRNNHAPVATATRAASAIAPQSASAVFRGTGVATGSEGAATARRCSANIASAS
jgi:hypothetical protein